MYIEGFIDISQARYATAVKGIKGITFKRIKFYNTVCGVSQCNFYQYIICYRKLLRSFRDSVILRSIMQLDNFRFIFLSYFRYFISLQGRSMKSPVPYLSTLYLPYYLAFFCIVCVSVYSRVTAQERPNRF
jgi:hypothetical protein